jgi:hypothetical protein
MEKKRDLKLLITNASQYCGGHQLTATDRLWQAHSGREESSKRAKPEKGSCNNNQRYCGKTSIVYIPRNLG